MQFGFIIANWNAIDPEKNSTMRIIHECLSRGHKVAILYAKNLTVRNNVVHAFARFINPPEKLTDKMPSLHKRITFDERMIALHAFDVIMIRKDPPIDQTTFNFLDAIKNETFIVNDVDGLRKANNKLYTSTFHDPQNEFLPVTHVSKNKDYLKRVIQESESERMILKPLDGSGGRGVIVLERRAAENISSLLDFYIGDDQRNYIIIQEYIEGAEHGDVRVLLLNGKVLGAYQRKPAEGELRANIQAGGSAQKYKLTPEQEHVCRKIGPRLVADGIYFAGIDLIGTKLLEVNVLNPGGITNINKLNKVKLQKNIVDFFEERVREREEKRSELEYIYMRLNELRQS